jgi:F-type H+-transporting ATPase subunit epsilon
VTLHVEVVSPERILWTGDADWVFARTVGDGEIAFATGHAPFVGALDIANVVVRPPEGTDQLIAVHGGFVEVSHDRVTVLSDLAELQDQIDVPRAERAKEAALAAVRLDADDEGAATALRRAELRLQVAAGLVAYGHH